MSLMAPSGSSPKRATAAMAARPLTRCCGAVAGRSEISSTAVNSDSLAQIRSASRLKRLGYRRQMVEILPRTFSRASFVTGAARASNRNAEFAQLVGLATPAVGGRTIPSLRSKSGIVSP